MKFPFLSYCCVIVEFFPDWKIMKTSVTSLKKFFLNDTIRKLKNIVFFWFFYNIAFVLPHLQYPKSILGGKYVINGVRDLTSGYDNTKPGNKAVLPISKSSQMITFSFSNGLVTTLRTSGTEPKVKYYSELCGTPEQQ